MADAAVAKRPRALAGRVILITGGTSGIGLAAARALAAQGATIHLTGRSEDRARSTAESIRQTTGNPDVHGAGVDLAPTGGVRAFAEGFAARVPRLDVLVNNAGGIFLGRKRMAEGHEMTWALNVLAPFQLTARLLAPLRANPSARVVNVSSAAHWRGRIALEDLEGDRRYSGWRAYCQSKLALLLLTRAWAERLTAAGIGVNAVHPGLVRTGFARNNPGPYAVAFRIALALAGVGPERGARTIVELAGSPGPDDRSGQYFVRGRPRRSSAASHDRAMGERLWTICARQTDVEGLVPALPPGAQAP